MASKSEERKGWAAWWAKRRDLRSERTARSRYGNRITVVDGIKFHSRLEADRYIELMLLKSAGQVKYVLRQVPFDVAPGVIYRADFLVVWTHGDNPVVSIEDTKGYLTDVSRVKIAAVQERYGIEINILARADVRRFNAGVRA